MVNGGRVLWDIFEPFFRDISKFLPRVIFECMYRDISDRNVRVRIERKWLPNVSWMDAGRVHRRDTKVRDKISTSWSPGSRSMPSNLDPTCFQDGT